MSNHNNHTPEENSAMSNQQNDAREKNSAMSNSLEALNDRLNGIENLLHSIKDQAASTVPQAPPRINKAKISPRAMGKQTPQEALYYIPEEVEQPCPPGEEEWWAKVPDENKRIVIKRRIDPKNHNDLIKAIQGQLERYLYNYKGLYTEEDFLKERLQTINDYIQEFSSESSKYVIDDSLEQMNLQRYEHALQEVIFNVLLKRKPQKRRKSN